jgi:hypothetical protein
VCVCVCLCVCVMLRAERKTKTAVNMFGLRIRAISIQRSQHTHALTIQECDRLADNRQQKADSGHDIRQQTVDSRQQTADSRQQTADSRQQTADKTAYSRQVPCSRCSLGCTPSPSPPRNPTAPAGECTTTEPTYICVSKCPTILLAHVL